MRQKLVHLILLGWGNTGASFVQFVLVQIVHGDLEGLKSIDNLILKIAILGHLAVLVRQFPNGGVCSKLSHDMRAWHHSLVENLAPS